MPTDTVGDRTPGGDRVELIDHHCHGIVAGALSRGDFELLMTESADPAPAGTTHFDTPLGLAIRRWCAPVLDLSPGCEPDDYLARRAELADEANRRLLRAAGIKTLLIETGYRADDILDPAGMGALAGADAFEVVRLEAVAEALAHDGVRPADYAEAFAETLAARTVAAMGLKSIVAYRGGFAFDPRPPALTDVEEAARRWVDDLDPTAARLNDPVLLRFGIWAGARVAAERGLPLQFHVGYGDPDITLHRTDPSLLTDLIRALGRDGVTVALLHCYPYHREAAYLAAVFPNVYCDVGLALNYTGAEAPRVLAEMMELAPFTKQLFSSDAFGLAELYYLGARQYRRALAAVLDGWAAAGDCGREDAQRIARLVGRDNASRIYPLECASA